jgi:uncharacterized protein
MTVGVLKIGVETGSQHPIVIPLDEVTKATAILGIRETGKSCLGTVFAEELCKIHQPWIALDPVGNWWGLRAKPDGSPGGYPVVVFGGERGDLPIEKGDGRKIAEAVISENVFAVIDLKMTSKTLWRTIVRDLVGALLEMQPEIPRKVFLEEAPEFIPQKSSYQLGRECSEIVERLVTLGGNYGYGATLLGQRSATISKDALSQCETVFAFAAQSDLDRKAYQGWIRSQKASLDPKMLDQLADLPTGTCWLWSPRFLKMFEKIEIRRRETFHPRDARKLKVAIRDVEMAPVDEFVSRVQKQLTKTVVPVPVGIPEKYQNSKILKGAKVLVERGARRLVMEAAAGVGAALEGASEVLQEHRDDIARLALENGRLKKDVQEMAEKLHVAQSKKLDAERRLEAVRGYLKPQWDALQKLFAEVGAVDGQATTSQVGVGHYKIWFEKAPREGHRKALDFLISHGHGSRHQISTVAGVSPASTYYKIQQWMVQNGLAEKTGDGLKLRTV